MDQRGKWVIAGAFLLALAAASFALWYVNWESHRSVELWGRPVARLIAHAPRVEVLRLAPATGAASDAEAAPGERLNIGGQEHVVTERRDGASVRGLINVRRGLLADATYDWQESFLAPATQWHYAMRLSDEDEQATIAFAFGPPRIMLVGGERVVSTAPVGKGLEAFFVDAFR